jgi:hypothetical protein
MIRRLRSTVATLSRRMTAASRDSSGAWTPASRRSSGTATPSPRLTVKISARVVPVEVAPPFRFRYTEGSACGFFSPLRKWRNGRRASLRRYQTALPHGSSKRLITKDYTQEEAVGVLSSCQVCCQAIRFTDRFRARPDRPSADRRDPMGTTPATLRLRKERVRLPHLGTAGPSPERMGTSCRDTTIRVRRGFHSQLLKLEIDVCQATVANYMGGGHRRQPPSQASPTFLRIHIGPVVAADLFVVPTATYGLLFVLVLLAHDRRRIHLLDLRSSRVFRSRKKSSAVRPLPLTIALFAANPRRWANTASPRKCRWASTAVCPRTTSAAQAHARPAGIAAADFLQSAAAFQRPIDQVVHRRAHSRGQDEFRRVGEGTAIECGSQGPARGSCVARKAEWTTTCRSAHEWRA